jgi:hypothetical protein
LIEKFSEGAQGGIDDPNELNIKTTPSITKSRTITLDSLKRILRYRILGPGKSLELKI